MATDLSKGREAPCGKHSKYIWHWAPHNSGVFSPEAETRAWSVCRWKGVTMQRRALRPLRDFISVSIQDRWGVVSLGIAWGLACGTSPNDKVWVLLTCRTFPWTSPLPGQANLIGSHSHSPFSGSAEMLGGHIESEIHQQSSTVWSSGGYTAELGSKRVLVVSGTLDCIWGSNGHYFGTARNEWEHGRVLVVEVGTENHRYLDLSSSPCLPIATLSLLFC